MSSIEVPEAMEPPLSRPEGPDPRRRPTGGYEHRQKPPRLEGAQS
jgi:hypothetical protein